MKNAWLAVDQVSLGIGFFFLLHSKFFPVTKYIKCVIRKLKYAEQGLFQGCIGNTFHRVAFGAVRHYLRGPALSIPLSATAEAGRRQVTAQVVGCRPWVEFLAPDFSLAQPQFCMSLSRSLPQCRQKQPDLLKVTI